MVFMKNMIKRKYKIPHIVSIYFGVPGSGKTTIAAALARNDLKHGGNVWSNVAITGCFKMEKDDIGKYLISDGRIIWDETGIDADNRNFKSNFTKEQVKYLKYHRHYQVAIDCFSQGFDDMDKKLRVLAQRMYIVKRSIIPFFVYRKRISRRFDIDKITQQPIDAYKFVPFSKKYYFCPPLWKMFNTISRDNLPDKEWEVY